MTMANSKSTVQLRTDIDGATWMPDEIRRQLKEKVSVIIISLRYDVLTRENRILDISQKVRVL